MADEKKLCKTEGMSLSEALDKVEDLEARLVQIWWECKQKNEDCIPRIEAIIKEALKGVDK